MRDGSSWHFRADDVDIVLDGDPGTEAERAAILGIRPEELRVADPATATIAGEIDVVEPTGPDTMVTATVGGKSVIARVPPRVAGRRGDRVHFSVDPASISLFDPQTEMRIAL